MSLLAPEAAAPSVFREIVYATEPSNTVGDAEPVPLLLNVIECGRFAVIVVEPPNATVFPLMVIESFTSELLPILVKVLLEPSMLDVSNVAPLIVAFEMVAPSSNTTFPLPVELV